MGYPVADRNAFLTAQITGSLDVALFTVAPDDEGAGGTEVTGGGYARVAHSAWNTAAAGIRTNNGEIDFGDPSADWGTVVAVGLYDGATFKGVSTSFSTPILTAVTSVKIADTAAEFKFLTP
jgi:hypothetical protein